MWNQTTASPPPVVPLCEPAIVFWGPPRILCVLIHAASARPRGGPAPGHCRRVRRRKGAAAAMAIPRIPVRQTAGSSAVPAPGEKCERQESEEQALAVHVSMRVTLARPCSTLARREGRGNLPLAWERADAHGRSRAPLAFLPSRHCRGVAAGRAEFADDPRQNSRNAWNSPVLVEFIRTAASPGIHSPFTPRFLKASRVMGGTAPNRAQADLCPRCPECKDSRTIITSRSNAGMYCRCDRCGHIWHTDTDQISPDR